MLRLPLCLVLLQVGVMFGNPETTSGGQALKYYSSMRLDIRAKEKIMEAGKADPVGNRVKVKVVKNKVGVHVRASGWVGKEAASTVEGRPPGSRSACAARSLHAGAS